jgi:DNA-binding NtrC family response regulator
MLTYSGSGLPRQAAVESVHPLIGYTLHELERALVLVTLTSCGGNRTRAAQMLGISIRTMRNKIREYTRQGIAVPTPTTIGSSLECEHDLIGRAAGQ